MPVDLIILCGFLGSGKTTLLVDYLNDATSGDTGVIVNEVGEIGVDGAIVANEADSLPMTLLANGCVCCSLRSDLVYTINALLDAPRPEGLPPLRRIILETSGVSRPGPIIASLADPDLIARQLRLTVVSTYDCTRGADTSEMFEEASAQLAAANRIVLTKTDAVSPDQLQVCRDQAHALNPLADIIGSADRTATVRSAFESDQHALSGSDAALAAIQAAGASSLAHPRLRVLIAQPPAEFEWTEFSEWLDDLAGFCGDRLLRVKAVVRVRDCADPILIQSVGTTYSAPRRLTRRPDAASVVIVIVRDLDRAELQANLPSALLEFQA